MVALRMTTMEEYIQQFKYIARWVPRLPKQAYLGNFINELKEMIKQRM